VIEIVGLGIKDHPMVEQAEDEADQAREEADQKKEEVENLKEKKQ
jgi:hypothetical protein